MNKGSSCSWLTIILLAGVVNVQAQTKVIDSLKNLLTRDSTNTNLLLRLSKAIRPISLVDAKKYSLKALAIRVV